MHDPTSDALLRTPLHAAHVALGARMVPFAGYEMPVQYPTGVLAEHLWTRKNAGLFDVSHMGQAFIEGPDWETTARAIETLLPADILNLKPGQQRYSQLLDNDGGILDDLMVARATGPGREGSAYLVVNAACKEADFAHIAPRLPKGVALRRDEAFALVALQGPKAAAVLETFLPGIAELPFMHFRLQAIDAMACHITRSGYTGEDGYEISIRDADVDRLWSLLLRDERVKPIGLGARDSLRLEAGLCLYGHDIDPSTSPVEAALTWSIQKRRREEGGFPGASRIQRELRDGPSRKRIGIRPTSRQPAREGAEIMADGRKIGVITSGGFGPSVDGPVAMGYVEAAFATVGQSLTLVVRGKELPATVAAMPFVPNRYVRTKS